MEAEVLDLVRNEIVVRPREEGAEQVASAIVCGLWPLALETLSVTLVTRYLARLIRAERRKAKPKPAQTALPGFDRLPRRISIADGRHKPLAKATYRQLREYLAVLHDRHREHPRVAQVKALVELVQGYAGKNPGITVAEVFERESEAK